MFHFVQPCQEIWHIWIRYRKAGCCQPQHGDWPWQTNDFRAIIHGIRERYSIRIDSPVLTERIVVDAHSAPKHTPSKKKAASHSKETLPTTTVIHEAYFDPYTLFRKVRVFRNEANIECMRKVLYLTYQLKGTRTPALIHDLQCKIAAACTSISYADIVDCIKYCIIHLPMQFRLHFFSLFEWPTNQWKQVCLSEYVFYSYQDQANPNKRPQRIKIPFFVIQKSQYQQLLLFTNLSEDEYPYCIGPHSSALSLLAHFESHFWYVF